MHNIRMFAIANLRKNKGQTIGMFILLFMTAMFMNIGLSMYFGVGAFYDRRAEELNAPHFSTQLRENSSSTARYDFIRNFPGVAEIETQRILHGVGSISINGEQTTTSIIIADGTAEQAMNPPHLIGEHLPLEGNAILIPYGIFLGGGYQIGDIFTLEFADEQMEFTIAGSTEEIFFGVSPRLYISSSVFGELQRRFESYRFTLVSARFESGNAESLSKDYASEFANDDDGAFLTLNYSQVRSSRVTNAMVGSMFIIIFSLIVLVVGVITIRFRINNDIEESMTNIGILKAVGFENRHIILSIVFQFGIIAFAGGVIGILLAQLILPMTGGVLEPIMGIPWSYKIEVLHMAVSLIIVVLIVLVFSGASSWRIHKLHPLMALRGDIPSNIARRNPMPLEKSRAPLSFLLSMKQLLLNKKQAVVLILIIAGLSFVSVFGLTTYYHVNSDALRQSVVLDDLDVSVEVNDSAQRAGFRERVLVRSEVKSVYGRDEMTLAINDMPINTTVVEDFDGVTMSLIDGRFPLHDNEILMGGAAMLEMEVSLGDWVSVGTDGKEEMYLIVGMVQTQINGGFVALLDIDGLRVIQPNFSFGGFAIVLEQGADGFALVDTLAELESSVISDIYYTRPFLDVQLNIVGSIFTSISVVLLIMVVVVVTLVLYLVVKTTVLRRRRELGIQKALGFTNLQLMNQIALNLLPSTVLGVGIGVIGGVVSFNSIYVMFLRDFGIVYSDLFIPFTWVIMVCVVLVLLTYGVSMFVARRIRRISAYALVSQ